LLEEPGKADGPDAVALGADADGAPSLDAPVDRLAEGYRAEAESLFGGQEAEDGEADLFSLPEDKD